VCPSAPLSGERLRAGQVDVDDGDQLQSVGQLVHHHAVVRADNARADEGEARFGHAYSIPSFLRRPVKAVWARVNSSGPEKPPRAWTSPRCGSSEKNPSKPSSRSARMVSTSWPSPSPATVTVPSAA